MYFGRTELIVCESYTELGRRAARDVGAVLRGLLARQPEVRMIFAAAESQATFLDALAAEPGLDWGRVVCFNMDEFWGPGLPEAVTCIRQLRRQLYDRVHPKAWFVPRYNAPEPEAEARAFAEVFRRHQPIDILCQGIGRSGHLALNEPGITRFDDPEPVRVVDVCEESIRQLRDDPNFRAAADELKKGITLTVPALMGAAHKFTMVPLATKRPILERVLALPHAAEALPASILYDYPGRLYMDRDSCPPAIAPSKDAPT
ncbi:MAG: Glucosamine-6-phosphate deaminase [Lentisphaerae bacterium ADurb.BinA184]|nr:MAG: Glucosamine-6-phosphate deaminase [Lentisphaerae bacterium ADurb.BinA184]